jgi:hypothetical protein
VLKRRVTHVIVSERAYIPTFLIADMSKPLNTQRRRMLSNTSALAALTLLELAGSAKSIAESQVTYPERTVSATSFGPIR